MKIRTALLYTLGMVFVASVCFGAPTGELVVSQGNDVVSTDPGSPRSWQDMAFFINAFDMLYLRNSEGVPEPRVAVSHRLINDTTWEFKLRKGIKFHNGSTMTAKDVKFSLDRVLDPQTKSTNAPYYGTIKETKVIDEETIQIITKMPDPLLLKRLGFVAFVLPSDLFREKGAEEFFKHPVGSGPFKFVSWVRNDRMILEANEEYWDGAPKVKRIVLRAIPEVATRIAELQTGNVDIITGVPPLLIPQLKESANTEIQSVPSGRVYFLHINTLTGGPLADKKVRQALNYAVDKKSIIDSVLKGSGIPTSGILTPLHFGFDASLKPFPFDPAKAKSLLAEGGYASGFKLVLNTPSGRYLMDKEISQAIAEMFKAVGVQTELKGWEWGAYAQAVARKEMKDMFMTGWPNNMFDADGTFSPLLIQESPYSYFSTPAMKEKIIQAQTTLDEKKRANFYKEIQEDIFEDAPFVFLYQLIEHYGLSKKVKGFQARADDFLLFPQVSKQP